jgi:hypothetical protein
MWQAVTWVYGGIMRIRRALVVSAILALGVAGAGSILAGSAMPLAAAHSSTVHAAATADRPDIVVWY